MDTTPKRHKRTNDEILADIKAAKKVPAKPRAPRRTKAQIEADNEAKAAAKRKTYRVVRFFDEVNAFGKMWQPGEEVEIREGSYQYMLAFDKNGDFILRKTPEQQRKLWGKVRYEVREEIIE